MTMGTIPDSTESSSATVTPISVSEVLRQRRSVRGFQDRPVSQSDLEEILRSARQSPSGGNIQPGFCHVLQGKALAQLNSAMVDAARQENFKPTYAYYPEPLRAPYKQRIMGAAKAMYTAANIDRKDDLARSSQQLQNYQFHQAPVGIVVTIDKALEAGSWVDLGAFIHAIMLAAQGHGLGSCAIGAIAPLHHVIADTLGLPDNELTFCGIALGYANEAPINQGSTSRLALAEFSKFYR